LQSFIREVIKQTLVTIEAQHCYRLFSNIILARLTPYAEEITGDNKYVL